MSLAQPHHEENSRFRGDFRSFFGRNHPHVYGTTFTANRHYNNNNNYRRNFNNLRDFSNESRQHYNMHNNVEPQILPSFKRRKFSATSWESNVTYNQSYVYEHPPSSFKTSFLPPVASDVNARACTSTSHKRDRTSFEDEDAEFMSRDEIERFSPSRKDGIDSLQETHLRYSYCAFLQNLGLRLELPQTTIGTAMVLCHRFFVRRSHASNDRFLIATAALFLAAKSEETPCPLNNVVRVSSEILHKQDFNLLCYILPADWFDQYREKVIGAEQMVLTTLNFELTVQHPYAHLTSMLDKLGFAQSLLVNLALSLVSEGDITECWFALCYCAHMRFLMKGAFLSLFSHYDTQQYAPRDITECWFALCYCAHMRFLMKGAFLSFLKLFVSIYIQGSLIRLRSSLWLQFKPRQIAAGAAYLAARSLNMDLTSCQNTWQEFHTPPSVLRDVVQQLMELF